MATLNGFIVERFSVCFDVLAVVRPGELNAAWPLLRRTPRSFDETELNQRLRLHRAIQDGKRVTLLHRVSGSEVEAFRAELPAWVVEHQVHETTTGGCYGSLFCERHALYFIEEPCPVCGGLEARSGA
jgi:hypothetical protein